MNIGQRIKQRRKELGLTADQLGEMLGKNRATIYRYENGEIESLPIEIIKSIADFLQTTPADLMGWEEVQKNNDTLSDIIVRMRNDADFFSVVETLYNLDSEKLNGVKSMLIAFSKVGK